MRPELLTRLRGMTEMDLYHELYRDHLTKALNRQAFELADEKFIAIIDLDSLKYVNDNLGHRWGDLQLMALAGGLTAVFGSDDVYRLSGDEFAVRSNHVVELKRQLEELRQVIPGFSFGVGTTLEQADLRLQQDKQQRIKSGLRAARGEQPPWFALVRNREE